MTNASKQDHSHHVTTRPLTEDMKRHVTLLARRLNNRNIPLSLDFDTDESGVEYASIYNDFVCFGVVVEDGGIYVGCNGILVERWTYIAKFSAEAEEAMLMSWRQTVVR